MYTSIYVFPGLNPPVYSECANEAPPPSYAAVIGEIHDAHPSVNVPPPPSLQQPPPIGFTGNVTPTIPIRVAPISEPQSSST